MSVFFFGWLQYEVFGYIQSSNTWSSCLQLGQTVTLGPFPAGTNVGFYLHSNGMVRRVPAPLSRPAVRLLGTW